MSTIEHVTLSELKKLLPSLRLPPDARLTVTIEDKQMAEKALKRQKALAAMRKLKGSGNGHLLATLLKERKRDALL